MTEYDILWGGDRIDAVRDRGSMPSVGFDYDSSQPDTDPFDAKNGGCCVQAGPPEPWRAPPTSAISTP